MTGGATIVSLVPAFFGTDVPGMLWVYKAELLYVTVGSNRLRACLASSCSTPAFVTATKNCVAFFRAKSSACWNVNCSNSPLRGGAACRAEAVASIGGGRICEFGAGGSGVCGVGVCEGA